MTRRALWQGPVAFGAILFMLGLGTWQVQRMIWKGVLIAERKAQMAASPAPLPAQPVDPGAWEFRRVALMGEFRHDLEIQVYGRKLERGTPGYRVLTPLATEQGMVMVDRGWVPVERKDPASRPESRGAGRARIEGIARAPQAKAPFVPDNDPAKAAWFWIDLPALAAASGTALREVYVEADAAPNPGGLPVGGQTLSELPDNHAAYAFVWYSLALACGVIYWLFRRRQAAEAP